MKILVVHNCYLNSGGEDAAVESERSMLESYGNKVILYKRSNDEVKKLSSADKIRFFTKDAYFSNKTFQDIARIINEETPDIAHFHNSFFLVSPSGYDACFQKNLPIVQTLHNYRFLCPNGVFYRNGEICEDCMMFSRNSAVFNKCWHNSYFLSFFIKNIVDEFYKNGILENKIKRFIALSDFSKRKFVEGGIKGNKISVKPNFFDIKEEGADIKIHDNGLFVGYLEEYKGVETLLNAYKGSKYNLKIIGEGPLADKVKGVVSSSRNIELLGKMPFDDILLEIRRSKYVVYPSSCYETFGRVVIEAFACGKPVIVSDAGAPAELIENGKTGYLFKSGEQADLLDKVKMLLENDALVSQMGKNARKVYEDKYTMEKNYQLLMEIYKKVI